MLLCGLEFSTRRHRPMLKNKESAGQLWHLMVLRTSELWWIQENRHSRIQLTKSIWNQRGIFKQSGYFQVFVVISSAHWTMQTSVDKSIPLTPCSSLRTEKQLCESFSESECCAEHTRGRIIIIVFCTVRLNSMVESIVIFTQLRIRVGVTMQPCIRTHKNNHVRTLKIL